MSSPHPSPSSPSAPVANEPPQQTPVVKPEPESRLEQLTARYDQAKAAEKASKAAAEEITAAIKTELTRLHPGVSEIVLTSPYLSQPLQLVAVTSWRFDSKGCKATHPQIYATFARQSVSWRLTPVSG